MKLWIDADACPVVNEAIRTAQKYGVEVTLVCDDAHMMQREGATTITVLRGADSADLRLVNLLSRGDAVVTQDYADEIGADFYAKDAMRTVRFAESLR